MGTVEVIVGGQYGSEGKGMITGYLARGRRGLMAVRVAGPNAGHTVVDDDGRTFKLRCIPVAAAVNPDAELRLAAGSEVDLDVLRSEMAELENAGHRLDHRFRADGQATIISLENQRAEIGLTKTTGSTGKGIGAARADRILRRADLLKFHPGWVPLADNVADDIGLWLDSGGDVQIEGTQGYGLGTHAGEYPHCTSSDCRAIDFLSMAGVSPWQTGCTGVEVWVVLRTFPIRIAGPSGDMYRETSWEAIGVPQEYTTVTNKVRRVGEWDEDLARNALWANGGPKQVNVALTFADYWVPECAGRSDHQALYETGLIGRIERIEDELECRVALIGTGPNTVIDRREGVKA